MKRWICVLTALMMTAALAACSGKTVTSGVKPAAEATAESAETTPAPHTQDSAEPTATPEPTATAEPTPEPTATPAPVSQDVSLNQSLFNSKGLSVTLKGLRFAENYQLTLDYEIANTTGNALEVTLRLNSANCWSLAEQTLAADEAEPYIDVVNVGAGESGIYSVCYSLSDPSVKLMQIAQIDHFSVEVRVNVADPWSWIGSKLSYVEVTGAPEPDFAYPAGDTLFESSALTVTSLGYDEALKTMFVYFAYPNTRSGGSLVVHPAVNGVAYTKTFMGRYRAFNISTDFNKQAIAAFDVSDMLGALGVDKPQALAIGVNLYLSSAAPFTVTVPLDNPGPATPLDVPETTATDDLIIRYAGTQTDEDGQHLVFYIENLTETEFLISFKDGLVTVDGTDYSGWGGGVLSPNITTRLEITLHDTDGELVTGLSGTGTFIFDYSPFINGTDYYSGARYTGEITVTLP